MAFHGLCPRERAERLEPDFLKQFATKSTDRPAVDRQYPQKPDDFRTQFERDYTRIIHSRAFRRLRHKTQVFIDPLNDHICTRLEHSLIVASISRTISKALGLNNELVAAISMGHDLGHAPFGHEGERCLDELAKKRGLAFGHEIHSLRVVDRLEGMYEQHPGLNLTFAVRDGIASHCGEAFEQNLVPNRLKRPAALRRAGKPDSPGTLEGCIVRMADKVAYLGRDLEDAMLTGVQFVRPRDVPRAVRKVLGRSNREIVGSLIRDIVNHSVDRDGLALGDDVYEAMIELRDFNYKRIYQNDVVIAKFKQIRRAITFTFEEVEELIRKTRRRGEDDKVLFPKREEVCVDVLRDFLVNDVRQWRTENPPQLALDFLAGMTDSFFIRSFQELFLPYGTV